MKYYNTIDTLPIFNYSKISEFEDLRYLIIQPDYFELPMPFVFQPKEMTIPFAFVTLAISFLRLPQNEASVVSIFTVLPNFL